MGSEDNFLRLNFKNSDNVYEAREDSYFVADNLFSIIQKLDIKIMLEMGIGSGIISLTSLTKLKFVQHFGIDINFEAIKLTVDNMKLNGLENLQLITSDLLRCIRKGIHFDLIVFNPPYLPPDEYDKYLNSGEKHALIGGETGIETTIRFIQNAKLHTNRIVIVISSLSISLEEFSKLVPLWIVELINTLNLSHEKLWLVLLTKGDIK